MAKNYANDKEELGRKSRAVNTNKTKILCIYIATDGMSNAHCSLLCIRAHICLCIVYNGNWLSNHKYVNCVRFFLFFLCPLSDIVRTHASTEFPIYFFLFNHFRDLQFQLYNLYVDSIARLDFCSSIFELWYAQCLMFGHCNK